MSARDLRLVADVAADELMAGVIRIRRGEHWRFAKPYFRRAFFLLLRDVRRQVRQEVRKERGR